MGHKHGIGPQGLGASGMNPKSTACGHPKITPLDFNKGFESLPESVQRKIDPEGKADAVGNYGTEKKTPLEFNVFENADPRAAANMMSDMAPTGGGNTMVNSEPGQGAFIRSRGITASEIGPRGLGGSTQGVTSLPSKYGNRGRGTAAKAAVANIKQKTGSLPGFGSAGPTVNSPGGGAGGAIASAEAAQASADAANSQMDALKEKLSGCLLYTYQSPRDS